MTINKTAVRIGIATRATIAAMRAYSDRNPGKCIVKGELIPYIVNRAGWIMEDDDNLMYEEEAITVPTDRFILARWADIILQAAEEHRVYIVWEPRVGVRLGTFEEFQSTRELLARIAKGIVENVDGRDRIIVEQGGDSYRIDIRVKQLPAGSPPESKEPEQEAQ